MEMGGIKREEDKRMRTNPAGMAFFCFLGGFWDACTKGQGTCTETELPILRGAILQILQAHPFCLHENLQWLALKAKGACAESEL